MGAAFASDKTFQNALNAAFEAFINLSPRAPEYISLFMDDQLRKVRSVASCPAGLRVRVWIKSASPPEK